MTRRQAIHCAPHALSHSQTRADQYLCHAIATVHRLNIADGLNSPHFAYRALSENFTTLTRSILTPWTCVGVWGQPQQLLEQSRFTQTTEYCTHPISTPHVALLNPSPLLVWPCRDSDDERTNAPNQKPAFRSFRCKKSGRTKVPFNLLSCEVDFW